MARRKKSNQWLYYVIGGILLLIVLVVVGKSAGWIGQAKAITVELAEAKKTSITEKVSASGMVQPVVEVKLSPEVSGELIVLNVEEGDTVKEGDVLAKVRPDNFEAAVEQSRAALNQQRANLSSSEAALARAEATFTRAKLDYERQRQLHEEKVISDADWQLAEQNYEVAKNDLKSSEKAVEAAQFVVKSSQASLSQQLENLRRTTVTAPMSGTVSKLNVEQGETVLGTQQFQGTEMMTIADLSKMEARVDVNENDIIRVSVGDTAIIDVDAYSYSDKEFKGVVTAIANTANEKATADAVTEFEVKILLLSSSYKDLVEKGNKYPFRPGMTASVDIITERKNNILTVPLAAVTTRSTTSSPKGPAGDGPSTEQAENGQENSNMQEIVFVANEGKAVKTPVQTGISDYENIEILSGLQPGDQVVSGPFLVVSKRLGDGDNIEAEGGSGKRPKAQADEKASEGE